MADERFKPDPNFKAGGVVGGYNSSDSESLIAFRIDPTTKRLLVDAAISSYTGVVDGEAVDAADTGTLILGTDGSNYQVLSVDSSGNLQVDIVAALPAGSNAIGKLAANSGVDIGDVDIISIIPGTGATNLGKAEDAVHGSGDTGVMALAVRNDALAALAGADGDYAPFQVNADGALYTAAQGLAAIDAAMTGNPILMGSTDGTNVRPLRNESTASDNLRVALYSSGTKFDLFANQGDGETNARGQIYVRGYNMAYNGTTWDRLRGDSTDGLLVNLGSNNDVGLNTGSNAIGKLAANSGVDIGDVDITSITGVTFSNAGMQITGDEAHDAPDAGNPIKIGGRAQEPTTALEEVADNDRVDAAYDRQGRLAVWMGYPVQSAIINDSVSGNNTIQAAAGAGKRIAVMGYHLISDGTTDYRWEDDADGGSGTFTGQLPLQAREGISVGYGMHPMWVGTANKLLNLELTANIVVHGQVSFVVMED